MGLISKLRKYCGWVICTIIELFSIPFMCMVSIFSRNAEREIDIGLGPQPLINNVYFRRAFICAGYTAETFVTATNYITDDYNIHFDQSKLGRIRAFIRAITKYKCIYMYFDGGPLGYYLGEQPNGIWRNIEPVLFRLSNTKVIVMPYGGDVFLFDRCDNYAFNYYLKRDYPNYYNYNQQKKVRRQVEKWCKYADYIVAGGELVFQLPCIPDMVRTSFLCIDEEEYNELPNKEHNKNDPLVIIHAVNHSGIKGSIFFKKAIDELINEGLNIEFINLKNVPGDVVRREMNRADIIADQLISGFHGMFALEGMAHGKPVITNIDHRILDFMCKVGELDIEDFPIIEATPFNVKEVIRELYYDRGKVLAIGNKSREYVEKYNSVKAMSRVFGDMLKCIGIEESSGGN